MLESADHNTLDACGLATSGDGGLQQGTRLLEAGGVFDDDVIDSYIDLTMSAVISFKHTPHRFEMYYSR